MKATPFVLNPPQDRVLKAMGGMDIILKARQEGISSLVLAMFAIDFITIENIKCVVISHEDKATQRLFDRVKYFLESMASTFPGELPYKLKYNSRRELVNTAKNSTFYIGTAGARAFGHGETINNLHVSELSRWPDQERMMIGLLQAVPKDGRIVIESTADGFGDYYYKLWEQNKDRPNPYHTHFLPWFELPDYVYPLTEWPDMQLNEVEQELMNKYGLKREQIAWRRWKINQMGGDWQDSSTWDNFNEQYPSNAEEAFIVSGNPVWSPNLLRWYLGHTAKPMLRGTLRGYQPISIEPNEKGYLKIFREPNEFHTYAIGCLPDGEKVLTDNGLKAIEEVSFPDKLVSETGKYVEIKNYMRRRYVGDVHRIKPFYTNRQTVFTSEHPIQVLANTHLYRDTAHRLKRFYKTDVVWKKAGELRGTDILRFPIRFTGKLAEKELLSLFPTQQAVRIDRRIDPNVILDKDFWYFVGTWLGDGWVRESYITPEITICFDTNKEQAQKKKIKEIIKRLFNRNASETKRNGNTTEIKFSSEAVYEFLNTHFGRRAKGKFIPEYMKEIPRELKLQLFSGYWNSDGCYRYDAKGLQLMTCTSISQRLVDDFQDILLSLGIIASVKKLRNAGVHIFRGKEYLTQETYEVNLSARETKKVAVLLDSPCPNVFVRDRHKTYGWIEDGYFYVKIHKLETFSFDGFVNNFETEDHTYAARLIVSHNCDISEGKVMSEGEEGRERDASCAQVLDKTTYEQVATWYGRIDPDLMGRQLDMLGRYYNDALIGVERNAVGLTPLVVLRDLNYPNLYYREKLGLITEKITAELGWLTTAQSKESLIADATNLLRDRRLTLYDDATIAEMMSFVRDAEGHARAAKSAYDDRVMALLIAIRMLSRAKAVNRANAIEQDDDMLSSGKGFWMGGQSFNSQGMPEHPDQMDGLDSGLEI